jgi:hypothetical protein
LAPGHFLCVIFFSVTFAAVLIFSPFSTMFFTSSFVKNVFFVMYVKIITGGDDLPAHYTEAAE